MAQANNQFWKLRSKHGRDRIFSNPLKLQESCYEYFEQVTANPFKEEKVFGSGFSTQVDKPRPFTLSGLYTFLGIDRITWKNYKEREEFAAAIEDIENIIFTQKFELAATGFLNPAIIARDLGLVDKREVSTTELPKSEEERKKRLAQLLKKAGVQPEEVNSIIEDGNCPKG